MIDLHMHSTYSDGTDSIKELLIKAEKAKLETISITDHNTCLSYTEMNKLNVNDFFKGNIIVGCEFTTTFDNQLIEIIGYGFNYDKVNTFLNNYYNPKKINNRTKILYKRLISIIDNLGMIYEIDNIKKENFISEFFERDIYKELIRYPENKKILEEGLLESFSNFYRKGLTNPKSKLFLNYAEFKPSLQEIIDLIHSSQGLAFLAHPYQYKLKNTEEFLNKIYKENNLDGIECIYTTFSKEQTEYLINFAKERNLLISGGSDYHGTNKKNHNLGIGNGNLKISKNILNNWNIKYFNK